ncbi:hypothetical protein COL922a_010249 [Colletotrichum nupharicola]|nr:hypothetical protein COL922a_010249 [Colletotrichum nupharicola]
MASLIPVKESDISIFYNSNTRLLESVLNTGLTFSIRAFAGGFPPQKGEKSFEIKHSVHINLPLPHFNNKTVLIEPSYNPEFLELIHSTVQEGSISWTFKWKKLPTEEGANPQLIDVTTHQYNGLVGPAAGNYITIQGYVVLFVVFEKK